MNEQKNTAPESVPGVQELFSPESITELENASDLCKRVYAMRTQEKRLADMLSRAEISKVYQLCQARVAKIAGGIGFDHDVESLRRGKSKLVVAARSCLPEGS